MVAERDKYVDLLRALSILAVVLGHWLVAGIDRADGQLVFVNILDTDPRFHPLTWVFQVMPVFFLVGGYANAASLARRRSRGTSTAAWLRARALRLLRPTAVFIAVLAAARLVAHLAGAGELVYRATWLVAFPLWFLVVYLAVVLLAPLAERAERRWGWRVIGVLVAGVAVGDAARLLTDDAAPAAANYLLGWLAMHQTGMLWRDGHLPASRRGAGALVAGGLAVALLLVGPGPYAVAMVGAGAGSDLANTAPPTLALLALATAQTGLVLLLRPVGMTWLAHPRAWAITVRINLLILTVFLWHVTALLLAVLALAGVLPRPQPGSGEWWLMRIAWILVSAVVLAGLVAAFARFEAGARPPDPRTRPSAAAVVIGLAAVFAGLAALGVTDTAGLAPTVAGVPLAELTLILGGLWILERAGGPQPP